MKLPKGGFEQRWVKLVSSARNEVLDMTVYAFGVFEISRQEDAISRKWREVQGKLREQNPEVRGGGGSERGEGRGAKEYVLGAAPEEKKVPGLPGPSKVQYPKGPGPGKKKIRIRGPFSKW